MSYGALEVGTAEFRQNVSEPKLRRLLSKHRVVEVGRYKDDPVAFVLDPVAFAELHESQEQLEQLRSLMPLLVAALSTGAAIPSETLARLGVDLPDDTWQTLNELQHRLPVRIGYGDDRMPIARGTLTSSGRAGELDEELVTVDD